MADTLAIHAKINQHEADIQVIQNGLSTLREWTESNSKKLDRLIDAMNSRVSSTADDLLKWLQVMTYAAALLGGAVSAIVYVAGNYNAADLAVTKYRLDQFEANTRLEYAPKLKELR